MTMENIKNGFQKCDIYPYNLNAIDQSQLPRDQLDDLLPSLPQLDEDMFRLSPSNNDDISLFNLRGNLMEIDNNEESLIPCSLSLVSVTDNNVDPYDNPMPSTSNFSNPVPSTSTSRPHVIQVYS